MRNNIYPVFKINSPYYNISNTAANSFQTQQPVKKCDEEKQRKIKTALIGLGIIGAGIITAAICHKNNSNIKLSNIDFEKGFARLKGQTEGFTGTIKDTLKSGDKISMSYKDGILQSSTRKGAKNFTKIYDKLNSDKIVRTFENGTIKTTNLSELQKKAEKIRVTSVKKLQNGRIEVIFAKGKKQSPPVELPEFLYHITSSNSMEKIQASDILKVSDNEQLKGLYLLDSKNYLANYGNTQIGGKKRDLLTAIFRQANKGNKGIPIDEQKLSVIRIPTEDLLKDGKLRIRTQEDFFNFTSVLDEINKKTGSTFNLRSLCKDEERANLKKLVLDKKIMNESEIDNLLKEMTDKIHMGYTPLQASKLGLENGYSIEYIFNHDIKLSDFPNIKTQEIKLTDYLTKGSNGKAVCDPNLVKNIFSNF